MLEWFADLLSAEEREAVARAGYGRAESFEGRPLLLLVDPQERFFQTSAGSSPVNDVVLAGCGASTTVAVIRELLLRWRSAGLPIAYSAIGDLPGVGDLFERKRLPVGGFHAAGGGHGIVSELTPLETEPVFYKHAASAFAGTALLPYIISEKIGSIVLCGASTSGCVRATAVDAFSNGLKTTVVADAVSDRIDISHRVALFDLWMKYSTVEYSAAVLARVSELR